MSDPRDLLARYQPWRRTAEIGFWAVVLGVQMVFNTVVTWMDLRRGAPEFPIWPPAVWELTSTLVVAALIPAVAAFDRRHPLHWGVLRRNLAWHLLGSVLYCAAHVLGMALLRMGLYALIGEQYTVRSWAATFGYEYLKDLRSYAMVLAALYSYRLLLLRLQGEARLLDPPDPPVGAPPAPEPAPAKPERFLVRKLRREFLVAAADIEWLQAEGNYVGLHVAGHDYLLRSTLTDFLAQLDPAHFVRVHRSWAVNLDRVAEIEPLESGDARLKMKDGGVVPCSRRYRDALGR